LRAVASEGYPTLGVEVRGAVRPSVLRTFDDEPREEAQFIGWASGFFGNRWGARLEVQAVVDADDDDTVRLDGTYVPASSATGSSRRARRTAGGARAGRAA